MTKLANLSWSTSRRIPQRMRARAREKLVDDPQKKYEITTIEYNETEINLSVHLSIKRRAKTHRDQSDVRELKNGRARDQLT